MFLGNWILSLTANATGMTQVLDGAAAKVSSFTSRARAATLTAAAGIGNTIKNITGIDLAGPMSEITGLGSSLAGLGGAGLAGGIVGIAVAAAAVGGTMLVMARNTIDAVAAQDKFAKRVGMTAQEVAGLQAIADRQRVPWENMEDMVGKWGARLGQLRRELHSPGGGPMVAALSSIGIDAERFASANLGEQLRMVSEGAAGIENPMHRLAIIGDIFGKKLAPDMARLLAAPTADLGNLAGVGAASGHNFSAEQAAAMAELSKQMKTTKLQLGIIFGELADDLAVTATPVIRSVVMAIQALATQGKPVIQMLSAGIALFFAQFAVPIAVLSLAITGLSYVVGFVVDAIRSGVAKIMPFVSEIGAAVSPVVSAIIDMWSGFFSFIADKFSWIGDLIGMWWDGVKVMLLLVVGAIGGAVVAGLLIIIGLVSGASSIFSQLLGALRAAIRAVAEATGNSRIAGLADSIGRGETAMNGLANTADVAFGNIINTVRQIPEILNRVSATPAPTWNDFARGMQQQAQVTGPAIAGQLQMMMGIMGQIGQGGPTGRFGWSEMAARMENENRLANLTREQKEMEQLRAEATYNTANATIRAAMEERLRAAQNERFHNEEISRLSQLREATIDRTRTPLEAFQQRMDELNQLFPEGGATYDRAISQAFRDLERTGGNQQHDKSPAAALAGSVAEQVAINAALKADKRESDSPQDRIRRVLEQMRETDREALDEQRGIRRALEDRNFQVFGD